MILDNEDQRRILLEMFDQCSFPGRALDLAASTRRAVIDAPIDPPATTEQAGESERKS